MGLRDEYIGRFEIALGSKRSKDAMTALVQTVVATLKRNTDGFAITVRPTYVNRVGFFGAQFDGEDGSRYQCHNGSNGVTVDAEKSYVVAGNTCTRNNTLTLVSAGHPFRPIACVADLVATCRDRDPSPIVLRDIQSQTAYGALEDLLNAPLDPSVVKKLAIDELLAQYEGGIFDEGVHRLVVRNIARIEALSPTHRMKFSSRACIIALALEQEIHKYAICGTGSVDGEMYRLMADKMVDLIAKNRASKSSSEAWITMMIKQCRGTSEECVVCEDETITPIWPEPEVAIIAPRKKKSPAKPSVPVDDDLIEDDDLIVVSDVVRSFWSDRPVPPKPLPRIDHTGRVAINEANLKMDIEKRKRGLQEREMRTNMRKRLKSS